jgi:hypothetical protein
MTESVPHHARSVTGHAGSMTRHAPETESYLPTSEAIAAAVFDLDGVLVASESVWDAARREVVARNVDAGKPTRRGR